MRVKDSLPRTIDNYLSNSHVCLTIINYDFSLRRWHPSLFPLESNGRQEELLEETSERTSELTPSVRPEGESILEPCQAKTAKVMGQWRCGNTAEDHLQMGREGLCWGGSRVGRLLCFVS